MLIRGILLGIIWGLSAPVLAAVFLDVYGLEHPQDQIVLKKYGKQVEEIMLALHEQEPHVKEGQPLSPKIQRLVDQRVQLIKQMQQAEGYLFLDIHEINYPGVTDHYITIDVVTKNEPERMHWVYDEHDSEAVQSAPPDLIDKMTEYSQLSEHIMLTEPTAAKDIVCPVYHCFMGFNHPQLKPYLSVFNNGVTRDKALILRALKEEQDPNRRASAVFLVGHFTDPQEIIEVLLPHVNDTHSLVRNNVSRVIGMTLLKAKSVDLKAKPFLELLKSPYITDRNKALFVLYNLSRSSKARNDYIQFSSRLLALFELKQPNQHDMAYMILKQLSGQDFGEHNVVAWQQWLASQQVSLL